MGKETMKEKIARLEEEVKDWEESYKKISDINVRLQEELNEFKNGTVEMVPREEYERILKLLHGEEVNLKAAQEIIEYEKKKREEVSKSNFKMILNEREKELEQELEEKAKVKSASVEPEQMEEDYTKTYAVRFETETEEERKAIMKKLGKVFKVLKASKSYPNRDRSGARTYCEIAFKQTNDKTEVNPRGAGRQKDAHLEVYLLSCWAKEMTDKEIVGSVYDGFSGKQTVSRASYYRAKKRLYEKRVTK